MSKRAEEVALKAYPKKEITAYGPLPGADEPCVFDDNLPYRIGFIKGYEQAQKDTIERAISWLKEHANEYIVDVGVGYGENGRNVELIVGGMCWEHLKKAMEE